MDSNKYKYLQRAIKRTYKCYIGDRNDGVATLEDLVKFFDIEIDSNRVSDYVVKSISYNPLCIVLHDKGTDTLYSSKYTSSAYYF